MQIIVCEYGKWVISYNLYRPHIFKKRNLWILLKKSAKSLKN